MLLVCREMSLCYVGQIDWYEALSVRTSSAFRVVYMV